MRHVTVQQLSAFLDGALTGVSRDLVTRHLAACADCRERHALWHIYDEVLQRVLSWEPNERTMEEASARVELTLTAERRGMPPPEFTSVLHPVIASTPDPAHRGPAARSSSLFPALPPISPAPAAAAAPPPDPASPSPGAPLAPPDPAPATPPAHARYMPQPASLAAPTPAPGGYPATPGPPPISVHEDLRALPQPAPAATPWVPVAGIDSAERPSRKRRLLWLCAALLAAVVLATPWLPDVIRIRIPESWEPRVPRVEFVRHGSPPAEPLTAPDPALRLAERTSSVPPPEPYRMLPAPVESTATPAASAQEAAPATTDGAVLQVPAATPAPVAEATPKPPVRSNPRKRPAPVVQPQSEDESGTAAGVAHSMTFVPVQVKTEVRLSSTAPPSPSAQAAATPAPAVADTAGDQALPLLCGEVVDESGAPIEGARIQFTSPPLTIRTDKRGRFCVSCPAGERTFLVDAPGFAAVTRGVELTGPTFETHITLAAAR